MKPSADKIFWFIVGNTIAILMYVVAVTFIQIPAQSVRWVDTILGLMLGTYCTCIAFYVGGAPDKKHAADGIANAEISASITTTNDKP